MKYMWTGRCCSCKCKHFFWCLTFISVSEIPVRSVSTFICSQFSYKMIDYYLLSLSEEQIVSAEQYHFYKQSIWSQTGASSTDWSQHFHFEFLTTSLERLFVLILVKVYYLSCLNSIHSVGILHLSYLDFYCHLCWRVSLN